MGEIRVDLVCIDISVSISYFETASNRTGGAKGEGQVAAHTAGSTPYLVRPPASDRRGAQSEMMSEIATFVSREQQESA